MEGRLFFLSKGARRSLMVRICKEDYKDGDRKKNGLQILGEHRDEPQVQLSKREGQENLHAPDSLLFFISRTRTCTA